MKARAAAGAAEEKEKSQAFLSGAASEEGAVKMDSGLVYRTLEPGQGASPAATDIVKVHYHGTLTDGTVFDSSRERGEPVEFPLNQVIPCWTEGVQKMKVGETAQLVCPSDIAYGDARPAGDPARGHARLRGGADRHPGQIGGPAREDPRVPGQVGPRPVRGSRAEGEGGLHRLRGDGGGQEPGLSGGGEGPDPRRRPGQGRGSQGGEGPRGVRGARQGHARHDAGDAPDRPRGPRGATAAHRGGHGPRRREGDVPRRPRRSGRRAARWSWPRPRAGWTSRRWRRRTPTRSSRSPWTRSPASSPTRPASSPSVWA